MFYHLAHSSDIKGFFLALHYITKNLSIRFIFVQIWRILKVCKLLDLVDIIWQMAITASEEELLLHIVICLIIYE